MIFIEKIRLHNGCQYFEPRHEKTNNVLSEQVRTQTELFKHTRQLEAGNFGFSKMMNIVLYPWSKNKGADKLYIDCEDDLRLCFRICEMLVSHDMAHFIRH